MWIAKKRFLNYEKGAEVKEEDAKKFGTLYCTESNNAVTTPADSVNAGTNSTDAENSVNTADNTGNITDAGAEANINDTDKITEAKETKKSKKK